MGWVLAAFLAGFIAGAAAGCWLLLRVRPVAGFVRQQAQQPEPPTVYQPPSPEEAAQVVITDEVKQRMLTSFQEEYGLSEDRARDAVEELLEKVNNLGSEVHW
jgi:hypothetical protein